MDIKKEFDLALSALTEENRSIDFKQCYERSGIDNNIICTAVLAAAINRVAGALERKEQEQ